MLLKDIQEIQRQPSKKRREEKDKFLFKRFFRSLQRSSECGRFSFAEISTQHLSSEFSPDEIAIFFRPTKESLRLDSPQSVRKQHFIPWRLTNDFLNRLLKIDWVKRQLLFYVDNLLLGQVKLEIEKKAGNFINQYRHFLDESHSIDALTKSVKDFPLKNDLKMFWTISEVNSVISEVKERIRRTDRETKTRVP